MTATAEPLPAGFALCAACGDYVEPDIGCFLCDGLGYYRVAEPVRAVVRPEPKELDR